MAENRRKHPRVRAQGIVAHLRGPNGRHSCQVENISNGGLFVRTDQLLDVGTQLEADLVRPGWKRGLSFFVRVTSRIDALAGRIAKVTPGMGLQFFGKMDEEQRGRLLLLLRQLGAPEPMPEPIADAFGLPPAGPDEGMPLETQTPLWQQVSMVEQANDPGTPLDAGSFPAWQARAPPAAAGTAEARLMLQIRGLLLELSNAQQLVTQRDLQIQQLREELEAAQVQLAAAKGP